MKQRFEKWNKWLNQIRDDVEMLVEHQKIFSDLREVVTNNLNLQKEKNNPFVNFIWDSYVGNTLITIRRQLKKNNDNSLVKLLHEIKDTPQLLSRIRFVNLFSSAKHVEANIIFSQEFSRIDEDHIDPGRVEHDIYNLKVISKKVEDVADKRIAHHDMLPPKSEPDLKEVNECIDYLVELLKKYWFLFTGERITGDLQPSLDDWQEIFRMPWILPDNMSSVDPTEWWNTEGDKEWDKWSP
jgi:archaellum component FlaC